MDPWSALALAAGLTWASGIRFYAVVFLLGAMHRAGIAVLPPGLSLAAEPLVTGAAGFMFVFEFLADKFPGLDSLWDALHTFVRIPGGAAVAVLWLAPKHPLLTLVVLAVFALAALWALPRLARGIRRLFAAVRRMFATA